MPANASAESLIPRTLTERFVAEAHPDQLVNLRSEEISGLLDVARQQNGAGAYLTVSQ